MTFDTCMVGFPFSKSDMNLIPVLQYIASSDCVKPLSLRRDLINLPSSFVSVILLMWKAYNTERE